MTVVAQLIVSCTKDDTPRDLLPDVLEPVGAARLAFEHQRKANSADKSISPQKLGTLVWEEALTTEAEQTNYVFVPIRTDETYYAGAPGEKQHPVSARLRASSADGSKWVFDLVTYIPEGNGWEASGGFTGTAIAEGWFDNRTQIASFYDGRLTNGPGGRITKLMGTVCYTTTVNAYVNGMLNTTYTYTTCITSGGSGSGGQWGPLPEPDPRIIDGDDRGNTGDNRTAEIHNNLTHPCLKTLLNEILDKQFVNRIGAILEEFNISEEVSLDFTDTGGLDANSPFSGHYNHEASVDGRFQIDLNPAKLPSASKEYATAVIIHETIHAYLAKHDIEISFLAFVGLTVSHENYDWWDWYMATISSQAKNRIGNTLNSHRDGLQGTSYCDTP